MTFLLWNGHTEKKNPIRSGLAFQGIAFEGIAFEGIAFKGIASGDTGPLNNKVAQPLVCKAEHATLTISINNFLI